MKNLLVILGAITLFVIVFNVLRNDIVQNFIIGGIVIVGIISFFGNEDKTVEEESNIK